MSGEEEIVLPAEAKIGRILERARQERGLSLKQVEQATKIRARYLKELERGNFEVLPTVYTRGSLKTYADHLELNGKALVRELEDQQASRHERDPTHDEPPKGSPDLPPILLGIFAGAEGREKIQDGEEAGPTLIPAGGKHRSYLTGAAALLVFATAAAVALMALSLGDDEPVVSHVREPVAYPAVAPIGGGEGERAHQELQRKGDERSANDESNGRQPREYAGSEDGDDEDDGAGRTGQSGQAQDGPPRAQNAHDSTPVLLSSAPTVAEATPAATEPVAAQTPPTATAATPPTTTVRSAPTTTEAAPTTAPPDTAAPAPPTPTTTQSAPVPTEVPVPGGQDEVVATKWEVVAPTRSGSPTQPTVGSVSATPP